MAVDLGENAPVVFASMNCDDADFAKELIEEKYVYTCTSCTFSTHTYAQGMWVLRRRWCCVMQRLAQRGALLHGRGQQERGQGEDGAQVRALPLRRRQGEATNIGVRAHVLGGVTALDAWASISPRSHDPPGPETPREHPHAISLTSDHPQLVCGV